MLNMHRNSGESLNKIFKMEIDCSKTSIPYPECQTLDTSTSPPLMILSFILMGTFVTAQILWVVCVIKWYKSLRQKIFEKGRLIQAIPFVAIGTIGTPVDPPGYFTQQHNMTASAPNTSPQKEQPPPYAP